MKRILGRLKEKKELSSYTFKVLAEEGSSKKFYRLNPPCKTHSYILMIANDKGRAKGTLQDWVHMAKALSSMGVRIPKIHEHFKIENALLLEDCSDLLLTEHINKLSRKETHKQVKNYYKSSFELLKSAQKIDEINLKYTLGKKTLYNDLMLFYNEHLVKRVNEKHSFWKKETFLAEAESLCNYLDKSDKCFTHRDFHSRNLLLLDQNLVLIDFQDACLGPRAYDLVSLAFDPYATIPIAQKKEIFFAGLESFKKGLRKKKRLGLEDSWRAVAIQRLYKILGSYNFLGAQKGKEKFLSYIKPTLETLAALDLFDERWPYLTKHLKEGLITLDA